MCMRPDEYPLYDLHFVRGALHFGMESGERTTQAFELVKDF